MKSPSVSRVEGLEGLGWFRASGFKGLLILGLRA